MDQVDAGRYGRLDDLLSGASVMVRWWELPEPVKAAMPRPDDIGEPWTLDTANTLQPGARG